MTHARGVAADHERAPERRRLRRALLITAAILLVELVGGVVSGSLALLADAGHVFTDLGALALSYAAFLLSVRPATERRTWGWYRIEILAALFNGVLLVVLAAGVMLESWHRLSDPRPVQTVPMMVAAAIGLAGNAAAVLLLVGGRRNLNVRGALMHVLGDTLSSLGVLLAGALILLTGWWAVDPIVGMAIGIVIVVGAVSLLRHSVDVLLEATPRGMDLTEVAGEIAGVEGVRAVHDLHIWSISSDMPALSGHVIVEDGVTVPADEILNRIKKRLYERYSIAHSTLQIESVSYREFGEIHE